MSFFKLKTNHHSKKTNMLEKYNLNDWWENTFNKEQREYMISRNKALFCPKRKFADHPARDFLYLLAGNLFTKNTEKHISMALLLLEKSAELTEDKNRLFKIYSIIISTLEKYKDSHLYSSDKIINYCQKQITLSADIAEKLQTLNKTNEDFTYPAHKGYETLIKIKLDLGDFEQALILAKKAKKQNWRGDWEEIIADIESKIC
ncbi:hypothetical protein LJ207_06540 [Halanaerobium sp. Z-7514]|uniref:Tetratricopeptide repeat protein n=1 Tax=Halanaerobium polyolivorans TaxID=2886943 RepID=A0AAW4X051_9FIRM|nr:hypothetical protein [Halanaerobium polyolivorans]MCC3144976.1 hypothetical protein [Halanaerobium polyolivorans]RQD73076.1 MAG: hypothetical protein D5S01_08460 [Halanaerobium sp. MSAO_Bac5]